MQYATTLIVEFDEGIFENDEIAVTLTNHAIDRSAFRYNQPVNIQKEEIERLVQAAKAKLIKRSKEFTSFVIHGAKNLLNVVGTLYRRGKDWVFRVITVMRKNEFHKRPEDAYVEVNEWNKIPSSLEDFLEGNYITVY